MGHANLKLSSSVGQIVTRIFRDEDFQQEALANPELAFAHFSLEEEERQALKGLLGKMVKDDDVLSPSAPQFFWFP